MDTFLKDLEYSLRLFRKSPGFTITVVLALALGIGAVTAIFSVVNTILLKPLHISDPDRLVVFASTIEGTAISEAKFVHWRAQSSVIHDPVAYRQGVFNYTGGQLFEQWKYVQASSGVFRCFGMAIVQGRTFSPQEELPGGPPVVIISRNLWQRRFAADRNILGKTISLNGESRTVIGIVGDVLDSRAYGPFSEVFVPFPIDPNTKNQNEYFGAVARLNPGVTFQQAQAMIEASTSQYRAKFPNMLAPKEIFTLKHFRDDEIGDVRPLLLILLSAVSLVLLIACANVANLLLVRAAGRRRETAVRIALGASRPRMIRQLLTESILFSLAGGALGLLLGYGGIHALLSVNTASLPMIGKNGMAVTIDWRVLAFALAISLATAIILGLFPALHGSRADLNLVLKDSGGPTGTGLRQNKARAALVAAEVSLAVVLVIASGLLVRSFASLYAVNPGFDAQNVLTMNVLMSSSKYSKSPAMATTVRDALERIRSLPGVVTAGATCCLPLAEGTLDLNFDIIGRPAGPIFSQQIVGWETISPGYFEAFKVPVKRGRTFNFSDNNKSPAVVMINEAMASQYWTNGDPLGAEIVIGRGIGLDEFKDEPVRQIIGIVHDIRTESLNSKPRPVMYVPQAQLPELENAFVARLLPMAFVVRMRNQSRALTTAIQEQLHRVTGLPVTDPVPMNQVVWAQTGRQRFSMLLMTVFGCAALLLATIGIYGLMAYTVEQRTQEIGIRLALGAQSRQVRSMVVRQGMSLVLAGVIAGLMAAWALARSIASFLFGVQVHDAAVFVGVPIVVTAVALIAVSLPANRASRVNVLNSLRYE